MTDTTETTTATVTVAAEHETLIKRAVALLESGETWIKDNIEAGVKTLEDLFHNSDAAPAAATAAQTTVATDAPATTNGPASTT